MKSVTTKQIAQLAPVGILRLELEILGSAGEDRIGLGGWGGG